MRLNNKSRKKISWQRNECPRTVTKKLIHTHIHIPNGKHIGTVTTITTRDWKTKIKNHDTQMDFRRWPRTIPRPKVAEAPQGLRQSFRVMRPESRASNSEIRTTVTTAASRVWTAGGWTVGGWTDGRRRVSFLSIAGHESTKGT